MSKFSNLFAQVVGRRHPWLAATIGAAVLVSVATVMPAYEMVRERALDAVLAPAPTCDAAKRIVVVDIDRESLARFGPWPWTRSTLADVVSRVAQRGPAVIAIDVLLEGDDTRSPAAHARELERLTGDASFAARARDLPDGDRDLAHAFAEAPVVLGAVLDASGRQSGLEKAAPVLLGEGADVDDIWSAGGSVGPSPRLAEVASGIGILSLVADADGRQRHVPLLARAGERSVPGFAVDAVRVASRASAVIVQGSRLSVGEQSLRLDASGQQRLRPGDPRRHAVRTISAATLLDTAAPASMPSGAIVLLGSSAPEAGGLRVAAGSVLVPSVQIQADAISEIVCDATTTRPDVVWLIEIVLASGCALGGLWLARSSAPLTGAAFAGFAMAASAGGSIAIIRAGDILMDPLILPLAGGLTFLGGTIIRGAESWRRAAILRGRLAQQLPRQLVDRIVAEPDLVKLTGERRDVTVLVTDLEGFTSMVERHAPEDVVAALDHYFEGVTAIVERHGGMVDKFVGDSVYALFNAPVDLDDHAGRALSAALEIRVFADDVRRLPAHQRIGFGRTRMGIETGLLLVGDVGGRRVDYTALGDAINTAARLEGANKVFGSTICMGPGVAARIDPAQLRQLGVLQPRGRSVEIAAFEPWPDDYGADDRRHYAEAFRREANDARAALTIYRALSERHPDDGVPRAALARLRDA